MNVNIAGQADLLDHAELTLRTYGDARTPERLSASNVWRWYYLRFTIAIVDVAAGQQHLPELDSLFICFDGPVKVGTLHVSSPDMKINTHEVKEFNNRFAIITFNGPVPEGTLRIEVRQ